MILLIMFFNPEYRNSHFSTKEKLAALITAGTLSITGCSIDSYLNDQGDVQCDGKRTKADFEDDLDSVSFVVHEDDDVAYDVKISRSEPGYNMVVSLPASESGAGDGFIEDSTPSGKGNPDFSFVTDGATWVVDVRPDEPSVVVSGNCS